MHARVNVLDARPRCRALVAGFGRPGMRDLDFGRQLIRYLEGLPWDEGVVVEDLSYAAPLVLHRLQELEPAKVVLVGAAARGFEVPGSLRRYRPNEKPPLPEEVQQSLSESVQGIVDVDHTLALARHYGALPAETIIIEVEPADCSFGLGFSEELAAAFESIVALVREELGCSGEDWIARDLEFEQSSIGDVSQLTTPAADDGQPSSGLEGLIQYARRHEQARLVARQRQASSTDGVLRHNGLAATGRSRPWGVKVLEGGDWFDVIPLEEGWFGCIVGDVPGRGVEAAAAMADLRAAVRAYAVTDGERPASMLERLDRLALATGLGAGASLVYVAYRPVTGQLRLSNAGHCPPLVLQPDRASEFLGAAVGPRLGRGPGAGRPEARVDIAAGSMLLLFTDGLLGSRSDAPAGRLESLRRTVALGPSELEELCDHVLDVCLSEIRPDDDICLLACRASEEAD